jgi:hypothetical protein
MSECSVLHNNDAANLRAVIMNYSQVAKHKKEVPQWIIDLVAQVTKPFNKFEA